MTRPQHTGTHIVEALSTALSLLAGSECARLYTGIRSLGLKTCVKYSGSHSHEWVGLVHGSLYRYSRHPTASLDALNCSRTTSTVSGGIAVTLVTGICPGMDNLRTSPMAAILRDSARRASPSKHQQSHGDGQKWDARLALARPGSKSPQIHRDAHLFFAPLLRLRSSPIDRRHKARNHLVDRATPKQ